jgi:hypothetical protein
MRSRQAVLAVAVLVAASGCAQPVWRHRSHNDVARFNADSEHCDGLAARLAFDRGYRRAPVMNQQAVIEEIYTECMYNLGYYRARPANTAR